MERSKPGRVVVGVGRSVGAYQALRYAVAEARRRGCVMVAVRAFRVLVHGQALSRADLLGAAAADTVYTAFTEALGGLPSDLPLEILVREGDAAHTLVSIADREDDLLVVGGTRARRWARPRSRHVARFCVRRARCPVAIIPPAELARSARADRLARDAARAAENLCGHGTDLRHNRT